MKAKKRHVVHLAQGEGQAIRVFGELKTFKTRLGAYTLLECTAPPGASGLPPHVHSGQDEVIYVLEGEYALLVGGEERLKLAPGSCALVPGGTVHALEATGSNQGRCLVILSPPGPLERFFEEVGVPVADRSISFALPDDPPEMEEVVASARRHGTYLLRRPV